MKYLVYTQSSNILRHFISNHISSKYTNTFHTLPHMAYINTQVIFSDTTTHLTNEDLHFFQHSIIFHDPYQNSGYQVMDLLEELAKASRAWGLDLEVL